MDDLTVYYKSLYEQQRDQIELIYNELGWTGIPPTKEILLDKIKELNKFKKEAEENSESFPVVESLMNDLEEAKYDEFKFTTLYVKMRNYVGKIHEVIFNDLAGEKLDYNYRGWMNLNSIVWFDGSDWDGYIKHIDRLEDKSLDTLKEIMKDAGKAIEQGLMDEKTINFIERYCLNQDYKEEFSQGNFDDDYYDEEHIFAYMYMMEEQQECDDIFRFPILVGMD